MESIIFIVLNLVFITILVLFLLKQGSGAVVLEESYSKQIALLIDAGKPGMIIKLDLEDGFDLARKNNLPLEEVLNCNGTAVRVKLGHDGGSDYSFFNDVNAECYPDEIENLCILTISHRGSTSNV